MAIYIVLLFSILLYGSLYKPNKSNKRKRIYCVIVFFSLCLVCMLRKYTVGYDLFGHYYNSFSKIARTDWELLPTIGYEYGYVIFNKLIAIVFVDPQWYIAIHSLIVIGVTGWFIYRNSDDVVLSSVMFITTNVWFMYMNIMRQALACSVCLIAVEVWKRKDIKIKRWILFFALVGLASTFHSSAVVFVFYPVIERIPFKRKEIIISIAAMVASTLLYRQMFSILSTFIGGRRNYAEYYSNQNGSTDLVNIYFVLLYLIIFVLAYYYLIYLKRNNSGDGNHQAIISNSCLLYMALFAVVSRIASLNVVVMSRIVYYFLPFTWILLPRTLNSMKIGNRKICRCGIYMMLILSFILITYKLADTLYRTVPYEFFWK